MEPLQLPDRLLRTLSLTDATMLVVASVIGVSRVLACLGCGARGAPPGV